jgi:hypothetical protein
MDKRTKQRRRIMKNFCSLAALIIAAVVPLSAAVVENFTIPVALVVDPATCSLVPPGTGVITGSGVLGVVIRVTTTPAGTLHVGVNVRGNGKATDENGGSWTWSDADLFESFNVSGSSFERTITESLHIVGKNGQKILIKGIFHVTVAGGKTVVELEKGNESEENEACEGFIF